MDVKLIYKKVINFSNKKIKLSNGNSYCLFLLWICLVFLFACKGKDEHVHHSAKKVFSYQGVGVVVSAGSAKDVESGIAAAGGHGIGLIFPYFNYSQRLFITLRADSGVLIPIETFASYDSLISTKGLDSLLAGVRIKVSPDKKHIAYWRKSDGHDTCIMIHFLEKDVFFDKGGDKKAFNDFPAGLVSPEEIAAGMMADHRLPGEERNLLWLALGECKNESGLDFKALDLWDTDSLARCHVVLRSKDWKTRSEKWRLAVKAITEKQYSLFTNDYVASHAVKKQIADLRNLCYAAQDKELFEKYYQFLIPAVFYSKECLDEFKFLYNDHYGDYEPHPEGDFWKNDRALMEKIFLHRAIDMSSQKNTVTTAINIVSVISVFDDTLCAALQRKSMNRLIKDWPGNAEARAQVGKLCDLCSEYHLNTFYIPEKELRELQEKAIKELSGAWKKEAEVVLEKTVTCNDRKDFMGQYKFKHMEGCPD